MPSRPKVKREDILATAFDVLIQEGYAAVNIKTLAQRLGCSTQPISWQFGGMDGLRHALFDYCLAFLRDRFAVRGTTADEAVLSVVNGYLDVAYDYPHLYRHLYMSDRNRVEMAEATHVRRREIYEDVVERLCRDYAMSADAARDYMLDLEAYVHGVASYIAVGFVVASKEEVLARVRRMSNRLLPKEEFVC